MPRGADGLAKQIYVDGSGAICRAPSTPIEYIACGHPIEPLSALELEDVHVYEVAQPDRIDPSCWMGGRENHSLSVSRKLAMIAAEGIISGGYSSLCDVSTHLSGGHTNSFHQGMAKELLAAASPNSTFTLDDNCVSQWSDQLLKLHYVKKQNEDNIF